MHSISIECHLIFTEVTFIDKTQVKQNYDTKPDVLYISVMNKLTN